MTVPPTESAPPAPDEPRSRRRSARRFLGEFAHALVDEATYDVRANPPLWIGLLMALPIPFLVWMAQPPTWLLLVSLPAPLFWAIVLGAAGRVGIRAEQEAQQLAQEIERTLTDAEATQAGLEEALGEEANRRQALERSERHLIGELKLAEAVHRTLIPRNIQRPDVEVAVRQIPSQYVGGDYLYAAVAADRYLYLVVGDVSGHGVSAALVVARLHGLIRRLTHAKRSKPATIIEQVNEAALQIFQHTYFFLTLGVFRLDLLKGNLRYATAGHPPQVLLRKDGRLEHLRTPNRLLGIDSDVFDAKRPSETVRLEPGDSLVLFTDGLFEILSTEDGHILGEDGFHDRVASLQGLSPALIAGEILQDLADFQGSSTFEDDVSLMVATWKGRQGREREGLAGP